MPKFKRQGSTILKLKVVDEVGPDLRGCFILADEQDVVDESWWDRHRDVGCIVNCLQHGQSVVYPSNCPTFDIAYVDVRSKVHRDQDFQRALPMVRETLEEGKDVVVHCSQSYHRAPAVVAAFMQELSEIDFEVVPPMIHSPYIYICVCVRACVYDIYIYIYIYMKASPLPPAPHLLMTVLF